MKTDMPTPHPIESRPLEHLRTADSHGPRHHFTWILAAFVLHGVVAPASAAPVAHACTADTAARLEVTVRNLKSDRGNVVFTLYPDDRKRWLAHHGQLFKFTVPATSPVTRACIALPAAASYALAVYHDENGNRHFDRNWIGMPAEGYGVSRNPTSLIGLPALKDSRFTAGDGTTALEIVLHY